MALRNPASVARIYDPAAYLREQVDLDVYAPAFEGMGLSARFAGTDVDACFTVLPQPIHGMWERAGRILIQEHKVREVPFDPTNGQHRALAVLAALNRDRLHVIITFGPINRPADQTWSHLVSGNDFMPTHFSAPRPFGVDVEQWPHRRWLRLVTGQRLQARDPA